MKTGIPSILLAIILALIVCLPALASDNSTGEVTITMDTESVLAISLSQVEWKPEGEVGFVSSNTTYKTDKPATWCTITNEGNADVNIYVEGDDAKWVDNPSGYEWTLISEESHIGDEERPDQYALWYHIARDTADSYTLITENSTLMLWTRDGKPLNLRKNGDTEQFGLKLLTPTYFVGTRTMEAQITVSAVLA
ncbi:MAG: hypothetical protein E3J66_01810 [Dehalococcoidia bacterium]|nr:MAG: hypothetical protein E3J66_01810 [Dehalococcoidia bacterium]